MQWTTACPDWADRIIARESIIPPPLYQDTADIALRTFCALRIVDAPGQPTFGEAAEPWVFDLVRAVFGAYDENTGVQHINQYLMLIAKKNGKSTIAAGIMLTALIINWRTSAELYMLGTTKEVADNAFKPLRDMIQADERLSAMMHVQSHYRLITHRVTKASIKVVAAESDTVSGKKSSFVLVDELHEFGKKRHAENMLLEIEGGLASRPEGFVIYLTTQSEAPPTGVFKQKLDYARGVRDGRIEDNSFLPILFEFPKEMVESEAYLDLDNAYIPNPNLGKSVDLRFLRQRYQQAKERGKEAFNTFLSKHLNVEVGLNLASDRWVGADLWEACGSLDRFDLQQLIDQSEVLTIGIDGGGLDDLMSIAVVGRNRDTKLWHVWSHAWAAETVYERRKSIVSQLEQFEREGDLTRADNMMQAIVDVVEICQEVKASGRMYKIGIDLWGGLADLKEAMLNGGIEDDDIVGITQGTKLHITIKNTEGKLNNKALLHCNQGVLNWAVGNAKIKQVGNAQMITKQQSGTGKIDPLMAMFNGVQLMADNPSSKGTIDDWLDNGFFGLIGD